MGTRYALGDRHVETTEGDVHVAPTTARPQDGRRRTRRVRSSRGGRDTDRDTREGKHPYRGRHERRIPVEVLLSRTVRVSGHRDGRRVDQNRTVHRSSTPNVAGTLCRRTRGLGGRSRRPLRPSETR